MHPNRGGGGIVASTRLRLEIALVGIGFLCVVAVFIVSWRAALDANRWVLHTQQVQVGVSEFMFALTDAQSGQRGYVITADARHLEPYERARKLIKYRLSQLRSLTSDNPAQQERLDELDPTVEHLLQHLGSTIAARRNVADATAQLSETVRQGEARMDAARRIGIALSLEEASLLSTRVADTRARARAAFAATWTLIGATLVTLIFCYIRVQRGMQARAGSDNESAKLRSAQAT